MKNKSILLMSVLSMSMTAYSINLSWLGKFKPVVSRAASVAFNYVKEHKVIAVGVGAIASAGVIAAIALYANKMYKKHVLGPKKLYIAVMTGNEHEVRVLLQAGVDPNIADVNNYCEPLLHAAVWAGNVAIVRLLCEYGANKEQTWCGSTPLHMAVKIGYTDIVSILVQAGANKDAVDRHGATALHKAAHDKDKIEIVRILVQAGANTEAVGGYGHTALHRAVVGGNTEIVRKLVQAGANKDAVDRHGDTALHKAAHDKDKIEIVRILVQAGANTEAVGGYGHTALHRAVIVGNTEIVRILVQAGANKDAVDRHGVTALHKAAYDKDKIEIVRILVQAGANTEAVGGYGHTALHRAVIGGNTEIVRTLVQAGANKEAEDSRGDTPLHLAVRGGSSEIVRILAQAGANIEAVGGYGHTALHRAVIGCNTEIVRTLVQAGANKEAVDGNGRTLRALAQDEHRQEIIDYLDSLPQKQEEMHAAARAGNVGKVQELVAQGAPVWPGIVAAIREYNPEAPSREYGEIARLLLETMGMSQAARAKCADGQTLLHVAAACGNTKFAEALLCYGAAVNAQDSRGNTPLRITDSPGMALFLMSRAAEPSITNVLGEDYFSTHVNALQQSFSHLLENEHKIQALSAR
jgi:ankyrin repeat protein